MQAYHGNGRRPRGSGSHRIPRKRRAAAPNPEAHITRPLKRHEASAAAGALLLALLPATASAPLHRAAVARVITDTADLLGGPRAEGQVGDILLSNEAVAFVIEAVDHPHNGCLSGGHVIDAGAAPLWLDELVQCATLLQAWPRQAVYDTVRILSDGSGGEAAVLAVGRDSGNANLTVRTVYSLRAGDGFTTVRTEIASGGAAVPGYRAGDAVAWGDVRRFLPGYGFDEMWTSSTTEWLGGKGTTTCYGYAVAAGLFPATHAGARSETTPLETDIPAGGSVSFTRFVIAAGPDLAAVSDEVHVVRGTATGVVAGRVTDETTGDPVSGALLDIGVTATAPYTQAVAGADGRYEATLPPASFTVKATADGYLESTARVTVAAGQSVETDFVLRSSAWVPSYGDTLTVIARPIMSVPVIRTPGSSFVIQALAPSDAAGWQASLTGHGPERPLSLAGAAYSADCERWTMTATVPSGVPAELYDLRLRASGGIDDTAAHAVAVRDSIGSSFYVVHITDTHFPTHRYWDQSGADTDTTEIDDLRALIEDINLMNPDFVIHTGDLVNEGELEDFLGRRYFTRAQRVLGELTVPLYMVPGNHDIGGWTDTPPPDGTARRAWWRFFGWRQLGDPPPGDLRRTQDYSFDHGGVHFTGLEAYDNYDGWRYPIYGSTSFTGGQLAWLADDLALAGAATPKVLFYHMDFAGQLNLHALGVDCALWGHVHRTSGSLAAPPYNLSLNAACDGRRAMRVVRFENGTVLPQPALAAGASGQRLRVDYDPANDGTAARVSATIVNEHPQAFEHGLVRFVVPADSVPYEAEGGALRQTVVEGATAVCSVGVPISASGIVTVSVRPGPRPEPPVTEIALHAASPNPAAAAATVRFALPEEADVVLEVFDLAGRKVATLLDGRAGPGPGQVAWDLTGPGGERAASGIYFVRLTVGATALTSKLAIVR
ncbi:MAG: metallophosphoesterase [Candidatus Eisenbacteria bacterium]|nr:metallophosphoesterase [Candidatus Eisenbacteria bacterium]